MIKHEYLLNAQSEPMTFIEKTGEQCPACHRGEIARRTVGPPGGIEDIHCLRCDYYVTRRIPIRGQNPPLREESPLT